MQQAAMLETLLTHLDAAASNGAATEAPAAEKAAEEPKKDDAAPAEVGVGVWLFCLALQSSCTRRSVECVWARN